MYDNLVDRLRNLSHIEIRNAESVIHVSAEAVTELREIAQEAADAIEELSREIDIDNAAITEMDAAMPRWIPITERLPEEDGEYLTWFRVDDSEPSFGIFPFDANVPAFGYWNDYYDPVTYGLAGSDFIEVKGVTHWMPLPEPPKEETE